MLAKPILAATATGQSTVQAGTTLCRVPAAPRQERTRGRAQTRQLPAGAELVPQIPYHRYFLQLGNDFWPEVQHILAESSCCNSFVLFNNQMFCFTLWEQPTKQSARGWESRRVARRAEAANEDSLAKVWLGNCCSVFLVF